MTYTVFTSGGGVSETAVNDLIQDYSGTVNHEHTLEQIDGLINPATNKIYDNLLSNLAITNVYTVANIVERDNLDTQEGDVVYVSSVSAWYIKSNSGFLNLNTLNLSEYVRTLTNNGTGSYIISKTGDNVTQKAVTSSNSISIVDNGSTLQFNGSTFTFVSNTTARNALNAKYGDFCRVNANTTWYVYTNTWNNLTLNYVRILTNVGSGSHLLTKSGDEIVQKAISAGSNITITDNGTNLEIASTGGSSNVTLTNYGNGSHYFMVLTGSNAFGQKQLTTTGNDAIVLSSAPSSIYVNSQALRTVNGKSATTSTSSITLNSDDILEGNANLFLSQSYKDLIDQLNSLNNIVYTIPNFSSLNSQTPIYEDEFKSIVLNFVPNGTYGLMQYATINSDLIFTSGETLITTLTDNNIETWCRVIQRSHEVNGANRNRININMIQQLSTNKLKYQTTNSYYGLMYYNRLILYGSNNVIDFDTVGNSNMTNDAELIVDSPMVLETMTEITYSASNNYQYFCFIFESTDGAIDNACFRHLELGFRTPSSGGIYEPMYEPSDFTIDSNSDNGYPRLTRNSGSGEANISLHNMALFEMYRRIYPVVRGTNDVRIGKLTINDTGLITSTDPLYHTRYYPSTSFFVSDDATFDKDFFGEIPMNNNHRIHFSLQLPDNYKDGTQLTITLFITVQSVTTIGNINFDVTYNYRYPESILGLSNSNYTSQHNIGNYSLEKINIAVVSSPLVYGLDSLPLVKGGTFSFSVKRIAATGTAFGGVFSVRGAQIKYQVDSFASL